MPERFAPGPVVVVVAHWFGVAHYRSAAGYYSRVAAGGDRKSEHNAK